MTIVHVAPTQFGRAGLFGGGERFPLELCRALSRHVRCELVTFGRRPGFLPDRNGLRVRVLRPLGHLGGHPAHPLASGLLGALSGGAVVHTHHLRSLPSRLAALTAAVRGVPAVVTDHGLPGSDWGGLLPRLFQKFLLVSRYSADELGTPPQRTRVIYGGADPERFHPDPEATREGVLFVGRITPHKGVDRLIEALPEGARLTVAGTVGHDRNPPEQHFPQLLERLAAGKDVRFLGEVSEADLSKLLRSAAVVALPSVHRTRYGRAVRVSELLGLTVIEAMASGTPVVASRIGGVPEVVVDGRTGFLVEPGNVGELRERLAQMLGDPGLQQRMGASGRERVLDEFTWEHCAARTLDAYEELAAAGP